MLAVPMGRPLVRARSPATRGPATPSARVVVAAVATLTLGCTSFVRHATYDRTASPAMRDVWMEYAVLVPADFSGTERLPIVVFLHGGGDGPDCLDRAGLSESITAAMASGELPRALIVVPQGDLGFWTNWYDGSRSYEDWVLDDLLPLVARRYHTLECPDGCHVMGVSMGAEGALRFAMHRPEMFASVTSVSGPALDTDRRIAFVEDRLWQSILPTYHVFGPPTPRWRVERDDPYVRWRAPDALGTTRLYLAWGDDDHGDVREGAERLHAHLEAHGIPHVSAEFAGDHSWGSWGPVILDALSVQIGGAPSDVPPTESTPPRDGRREGDDRDDDAAADARE